MATKKERTAPTAIEVAPESEADKRERRAAEAKAANEVHAKRNAAERAEREAERMMKQRRLDAYPVLIEFVRAMVRMAPALSDANQMEMYAAKEGRGILRELGELRHDD